MNGTYDIEINEEETLRELAAPELHGKRVGNREGGFVIEFIGPKGVVLSVTKSSLASFVIDDTHDYVKAKVIFRRMHRDRGMEEFYAWGLPFFSDGRTNN